MPHDHGHKLAVYHKAGAEEMERDRGGKRRPLGLDKYADD